MSYLILIVALLNCLVCCEPSPAPITISESGEQNVTLGMRMGSEMPEDSAGMFSITQADQGIGITGQVAGTEVDQGLADQDMAMNPELDLGSEVMLEDMTQNCLEGDIRQQRTCGMEQCQNGSWISLINFEELCNQWDDDCDNIVDEDPSPMNLTSECCDGMFCMSRAFCEAGLCQSLGENDCLLDGDCEEADECLDNLCQPLYVITPPRASASCQEPIIATLGRNQVNGHSSTYLFSATRCIDEEFRTETILGPEVIFRVQIINSGRYSFVSKVSNGDRNLPSTITMLSTCDPMAQATWCYSTETTGLTLDGGTTILRNNVTFDLDPGEYFIIIDTHYQKLYEELRMFNLQLNALSFQLDISER